MATNKYSNSVSETGRNYIITENNPWFGSKYTSYDTNEGGGYHFRKYPDGLFRMFNNKTGEFLPVTDDEQIEYLQNRSKVLDQNSDNERLNIFGRMMPRQILDTKFGNLIGHLENGGIMNYAQYLQGGGEAQLSQEEQEALAAQKQRDDELVEIIKQNPDSLPQLIEQYGEEAPGLVKHIMDLAIENQDEDLAKLIAPFAKQFNIASFKCGGRVRAKVKKANCGKKLEKGSKVPEVKKGGCPCQWKKVGGKLIEVDCNGIPVAKNGMKVPKFETPASPIDIKRETNNVYSENALKQAGAVMSTKGPNRWYYQSPVDGKIYTAGTPFANNNVDEEFKIATPEQIDIYHNLKGHKKNAKGYYETIDGGYKYLTGDWAGRTFMQGADGKYYGNFGDEWAVWDKANKTWTKEGFIYDPIKGWTASKNSTEKEAPDQATLDWRANFGAGKKGKFGGYTYDDALKMQNEMLAAKDKGFIVDLGKWGPDGKWGSQSRKEWERYQQWKADQELAARKAPIPGLQRALSENKYFSVGSPNLVTRSTPSSTVSVTIPTLNRTFAAANIGGVNGTNLRGSDRTDLNTMTGGQALSLNKGDYENWLNNFRNRTLYLKDGGKLISYKEYLK